ncbi:MAG: CDP-archaeol synthase [Oscillospiraceae bacterium]
MEKLAEMYISLLPVILAGIFNMVWCKIRFCSFLSIPVDNGKNFKDGKRIFGDNKTWKGFVGMIIFGALFTVLWGYICSLNTYLSEHNYFYVNFENTFLYNLATGALTGFAYALFELPNSFIKRRLDITPGKPSEDKLKRAFFIFLDQADSIFGCVLVICLVCPLPVWYYFLYVAVGAVTHIIFNMLLYFCHLRKNMF